MAIKQIGMILDQQFPPDVRVENEIDMLRKEGVEVKILCYPSEKKYCAENKTLYYVRIPNYFKRKLKPFIGAKIDFYTKIWTYAIIKFCTQHKIDLLHVHDLYMAPAALAANQKLNIKLVLDLHENFPAAFKSYTWSNSKLLKIAMIKGGWEILEKKILEKTSNIIVLSDSFKDYLINKYPSLKQSKFLTLPNVPNMAKFNAFPMHTVEFKKDVGDLVFFYFGKIGERRGIFQLLDAFEEIVKSNQNVKLMILGPVDNIDKERFNQRINSPELKPLIFYKNWIEMSELPSYAAIADVGVSPLVKNPQHDSGVSNKVFQYMNFKLALLVSDSTAQADLVLNCKNGLVYDNLSTADLISKMNYIIENPKRLDPWQKNSSDAIERAYNVNEFSKQLIDFYSLI